MQVEEMYRLILGIEAPWRIATVQLDAKTSNVHVKRPRRTGARGGTAVEVPVLFPKNGGLRPCGGA